MIFYHERELYIAYEEYCQSMPEGSMLIDIEKYRREIFEPLLNEMYDE